MVAEKTGYPEDMLELDLDMEADLGIDTVKQAEMFAAMREHYGIVSQEGVQLKDYPTIRHCIKFVLDNAGKPAAAPVAAPAPAPVAAPAPVPVPQPVAQPAPVAAPAPAAVPAPAPKALDEATVTKEIVTMVAEKTGYPEDMLELDLDMEADLGIDTVKQAEMFAAMREHYGIVSQEGVQLKDYPTIRHCIKFVLDNAGKTATAPVAAPAPVAQPAPAPVQAAPAVTPAPAPQPAPVAQPALEVVPAVAETVAAPAVAPAVTPAPQPAPEARVAEPVQAPAAEALETNPTAPVEPRVSLAERPEREGYQGEHCHEKKLRYVPQVADAPLARREERRLSKDRTVLLFADNAQFIKA